MIAQNVTAALSHGWIAAVAARARDFVIALKVWQQKKKPLPLESSSTTEQQHWGTASEQEEAFKL